MATLARLRAIVTAPDPLEIVLSRVADLFVPEAADYAIVDLHDARRADRASRGRLYIAHADWFRAEQHRALCAGTVLEELPAAVREQLLAGDVVKVGPRERAWLALGRIDVKIGHVRIVPVLALGELVAVITLVTTARSRPSAGQTALLREMASWLAIGLERRLGGVARSGIPEAARVAPELHTA